MQYGQHRNAEAGVKFRTSIGLPASMSVFSQSADLVDRENSPKSVTSRLTLFTVVGFRLLLGLPVPEAIAFAGKLIAVIFFFNTSIHVLP